MKSVLALNPNAVILGADPPRLNCCDLLSEIKGSDRSQNIRVLMLAPGASAERSRGLDLGADDVLSLPFEPHELLSRLRWQLRDKRTTDDLRRRAELEEENRKATQQVVTAADDRASVEVARGSVRVTNEAGKSVDVRAGEEAAIAKVVRSAGRTLVLISGGSKISDEDLIHKARIAMEAGVTGLIFGRNVWQRRFDQAMAITQRIHELLKSYGA